MHMATLPKRVGMALTVLGLSCSQGLASDLLDAPGPGYRSGPAATEVVHVKTVKPAPVEPKEKLRLDSATPATGVKLESAPLKLSLDPR